MVKQSLGTILRESRTAHGLSMQQVAERADCSPGYIHKLEMDRVRTPSPRVLAGLAEALGLTYAQLMDAAGYQQTDTAPQPPTIPGAIKRYSNAHIVELIEHLRDEVHEIHKLITNLQPAK